jgi:hypothetical protein
VRCGSYFLAVVAAGLWLLILVGGADINKAAKYILWRFTQTNRARLSIYPHLTQATDTSNVCRIEPLWRERVDEVPLLTLDSDPTGVRRCEGNDPAKRSARLGYPMRRFRESRH